jgi:L-asparaginase
LGVLVSFAGAVLAPLGLAKLGGPPVFAGTRVGSVTDGAFSVQAAAQRPYLGPLRSAPRVDIASGYPGADGTAIDAFAAAGARGVGERVGATEKGGGRARAQRVEQRQQLAAQGAKFGTAMVDGGQADRAQYPVRYWAGAGNLQVVSPGRVLVQRKHGAS